MPLYEYTCESCRSDFEALVYGNQQPECPDCGGVKLAKRLSVPAAHSGTRSLPVCEPPSPGGCGLPGCGQGACQME